MLEDGLRTWNEEKMLDSLAVIDIANCNNIYISLLFQQNFEPLRD